MFKYTLGLDIPDVGLIGITTVQSETLSKARDAWAKENMLSRSSDWDPYTRRYRDHEVRLLATTSGLFC